MEHDAIVLALAGQLLDLGDVFGSEVRAHLDHDPAVIFEVDIERVFPVSGDSNTSRGQKNSDESLKQTHDASLAAGPRDHTGRRPKHKRRMDGRWMCIVLAWRRGPRAGYSRQVSWEVI